MKPNQTYYASPQFMIFSVDQLHEIHLKTLEVLERTGVEVNNSEALRLLSKAGAYIDGTRVRIPGWLVEEGIKKAPSRIVLSNRSGDRALSLEKNQPYFGLGSDLPYTFDFATGKRRVSNKKDVVNATKVAQNMNNIDFVMSMAIATEFGSLSYLHQFHAMVENTDKPIIFTSRDGKDIDQIIEIASFITGGKNKLREAPFIACYAEPISPLQHSDEGLKKLLTCAKYGIPVIYTPGMMAGATAPVTLAGAVVTANAELLSGLLIHQLKRKGAPFIYGGGVTVMDMKSSLLSYGAPEMAMNGVVLTQMSHKYELPMFSIGGCSDSPIMDAQAAMEQMFNLLLSALSGANLIHDVGYVNNGLTQSLASIVINNEALNMVKRLLRGLEVTDITVPIDVIDEVGPRGQFLTHEHTYKHFKEEFWSPKLFIRNSFEDWEKEGSQSIEKRANKIAEDILSSKNEVKLEKEISDKINDYLQNIS